MIMRYLLSNLIVVTFGLSMLGGCSDSEQRAKGREKFGIELYDKGEYSKAELEFKSAIKEDKTLANAYYYLALLDEKNKRYVAMRENLTIATKLEPDNIKARINLGRVFLLFNNSDDALLEANEILKLSGANLEGLTIRAAAFIKQKKQGDALVVIDAILAIQPQYIEAISLKALILMQNQQYDGALTLLNPAIISGVDNISLHLLKIQLDSKKNNIDAVITDYERLSNLHPENREFKYALAKIYAQANRIQDAESLIRQEVYSAPLEIQPKLVLLDFLYSKSRSEAVEEIKHYSSEFQDKPKILLEISQWLLANKYLSDADSLLNNTNIIESSIQLKQKSKLLLATVAFHNKEFEKSKGLIAEIFEINAENNQARILLAKNNIAQEQYDSAAILLNTTLLNDPNSDQSLVLLAQLELIKGHPEKADKKFREALNVNPVNMKALTLVTNRSLRNYDVKNASDLLKKALKLQPSNLDLLKIAVEIKIVSGDWSGAKEILDALESHSQDDLVAKFLMGRIYQEKGDYLQAVYVFKEILARSPDYPNVLRQMAICYEMMNQRSDMINYVKSFLINNSEHIPAHIVLGELYFLNKNHEKAIATYSLALRINKKIPQIYGALAKVYNQQKEYIKAIGIYENGLEENPVNVRLSIYLASVYEEIKQYDKAKLLYESLLGVDPELDIATNNYAALLVDDFGDSNSLAKARQLVVRFKHSKNPYYLDSFAWIELKMGNLTDAVILLEKVNDMSEQAVFKYHLGVAYQQKGNEIGAVAYLKQAIELGQQKGGFDEINMAQQLLDDLLIVDNL